MNCTSADQTRYKEYRNIYNKLKSKLRRDYYWQRCEDYKKKCQEAVGTNKQHHQKGKAQG